MTLRSFNITWADRIGAKLVQLDRISFPSDSYLRLSKHLKVFLQSCVKGGAEQKSSKKSAVGHSVECLNPVVADPCGAGICGNKGSAF